MTQRVGLLKAAQVFLSVLRVVTTVVLGVAPATDGGKSVIAVFFVVTAIGGVIGWWLGKAETTRNKASRRAIRLVSYALGWFVVYLGLTWALPKLGLWVPAIYDDDLFLPMTAIRAIPWAASICMLVRLIAVLDRKVAQAMARSPHRD